MHVVTVMRRMPEVIPPFAAIIWDGYCIGLEHKRPNGWEGKR